MNYCPPKNSKCGGPKYDPESWELNKEEHEINNCYSYAMNIKESNIEEKRQPGELCGREFKYDCENIEKMMKCDFPSIQKIEKIDTPIPCSHYRIALVLDNSGEHLDYHFYRQDIDGYWSHKTGNNPITNSYPKLKAVGLKVNRDPHLTINLKNLIDVQVSLRIQV